MTGAVVAAFDVDGTLTQRDCVVPFLRRLGGLGGIAAALARRPGAALRAAVRRDRDAMKEIVVGGVFAGRRVDEVCRLGAGFATGVLATGMRPDTVARLRWHQRAGHATVLVSASLRPYLEPLGASLGVDAVLCTDVRAADGIYASVLEGGNCRGRHKADRLRAWMAASGRSSAQVWAYGDSDGDRELLAMATRPHLVRGVVVPAVPEGEVDGLSEEHRAP